MGRSAPVHRPFTRMSHQGHDAPSGGRDAPGRLTPIPEGVRRHGSRGSDAQALRTGLRRGWRRHRAGRPARGARNQRGERHGQARGGLRRAAGHAGGGLGGGLPPAPQGLQVPRDLARQRGDERRQPDAGDLRRHRLLRGPAQHGGPDPQPREPVARERDHASKVPNGKRYDPDPNVRGGNTKLVVDKGSRRVVESFARARRHAHQLRRRRHAVGLVDHLRGDLQLRLGGEQRHAGHRRAARLRLRGAGRRARPGLGRADHRRGTLRPRGVHRARRDPLRDRGPRRRRLLPLRPRPQAARVGRPGDVRRHAPGAQGAQPAQLRHGHRPPGRVVPDRVGDGRRAQPAGRERRPVDPRAGAGEGRRDLHPHGGHLDVRQAARASTARPAARPAPASCGSSPRAARTAAT